MAIINKQRRPRLTVCAYVPDGEYYPVLCVRSKHGLDRQGRDQFGQFLSHAVRRGDSGYEDLLAVCDGFPIWLYGQAPRDLK